MYNDTHHIKILGEHLKLKANKMVSPQNCYNCLFKRCRLFASIRNTNRMPMLLFVTLDKTGLRKKYYYMTIVYCKVITDDQSKDFWKSSMFTQCFSRCSKVNHFHLFFLKKENITSGWEIHWVWHLLLDI